MRIAPEPLLMSVKWFPDRREWIAVITRGGHPRIPDSGPCEVVDVECFKNRKDAQPWFERRQIERPWETRS